MQVKMIGDFILVRRLKSKVEKIGDIVVPTAMTLSDVVMYGQVEALGKKTSKSGENIPYDVAIGDYVILDPKFGMQKFKKDGMLHVVLKEDAILCTIDPEGLNLVDVTER